MRRNASSFTGKWSDRSDGGWPSYSRPLADIQHQIPTDATQTLGRKETGASRPIGIRCARMRDIFRWLTPRGMAITLGIGLGGLWTSGHAATPTAALHSCHLPGMEVDVQCGSIKRPLDPTHPEGVQIDVHFAVLPAVARNKLPDPVFFFAGGPGQAAMRLGAEAQTLLKRLQNRRDVVLIDQRGTGQSAPLECPRRPALTPLRELLVGGRWDAYLADCLDHLQKLPYGDLRFFTTTIAMQDADAVRAALGFAQINLLGGSYGTRAVIEYLRQFPSQSRRAIIDGVAPPDMQLPATLGTDAQKALDTWLSFCQQDAACQKRYPNLISDWQKLVASLPKEVSALHPVSGIRERFTLTRLQLLAGVRSALYVPLLTSALPAALAEAAAEHYEPLLALSSTPAGPAMQLAMGMHLSVICSEDFPAKTTPPATARDFGDVFAQQYAELCAHWPHGNPPADFYRIPNTQTPTLILSGGLDPVTPPRHADRVAKALGSHARHIVVPNAGHGVIAHPCMPDLMFRFFDGTSEDAAFSVIQDAGCATAMPRPPLYLPFAAKSDSASASPEGNK